MAYWVASYAPWIGSVILREEGIHNLATDHGDNFYMTIPLMVMVNRCLKKSPLVGLGVGAGANFLEEVSVNGRSISQMTKREETDWADLEVGMSAVGSYALWVALSEKLLSIRFERSCR